MFTGIIEELGTVDSLSPGTDPARLRIRSPHVLEGIALGDSIAVSGCCLTVTAVDGEHWSADVISTTLAATSLGGLCAGDTVNLERCVRADGRLDGDIVQGDVGGVCEVVGAQEHAGAARLRLAPPEGLARYGVAQGSLAAAGVRLALAAIARDQVTIGLIPETPARTTLGRRAVGDRVTLEVDVLAKYVEKLTATLLPGTGQTRSARCAWTPSRTRSRRSPPAPPWSSSMTRTGRTRAI